MIIISDRRCLFVYSVFTTRGIHSYFCQKWWERTPNRKSQSVKDCRWYLCPSRVNFTFLCNMLYSEIKTSISIGYLCFKGAVSSSLLEYPKMTRSLLLCLQHPRCFHRCSSTDKSEVAMIVLLRGRQLARFHVASHLSLFCFCSAIHLDSSKKKILKAWVFFST